MTSRSEMRLSSTSGIGLFEVLVSLSIIAMVLGVSLTSLRGPSPALKMKQQVADMQARASAARTRAIETGGVVRMTLEAEPCDDAPEFLVFYPDGSTPTGPLCLQLDGLETLLTPDPLTGRLLRNDGDAD